MQKKSHYKRVLLKLSGEILANPTDKAAISKTSCENIAKGIKALQDQSIQIGIVIGGGNIFRGIQSKAMGIERTPADQMGMLSTLINGIALQQALTAQGCKARVMSALDCPKVCESYNWHKAHEYLANNEILIFVGGTGNPYFTTDTAAALRASEIHAEVLLKATKVDGIYNKDPLKYSDARKYSTLTYSQFLAEKLEVMDATSVALCMQSHIPILVFNMEKFNSPTNLDLLSIEKQGTLVKEIHHD